MSYVPIADYALIGDCHGTALVAKSGSIDWACLSRFDCGAMFCRILDDKKGGAFAIDARNVASTSRRYLPDTNVLETTFTTDTGTARILDCLTMREGGKTLPFRQLLRIVEGVSGYVDFDVLIEPRFDYASLKPWVRYHRDEEVHSAVGGSDAFVFQADADLHTSEDLASLTAALTVRANERSRFSLTIASPHELDLTRLSSDILDQRLADTIGWWKRWVDSGCYDELHRDAVVRSALVLKLLTCGPTGAIIAAPTTSLPEQPGADRNWDYRYSWIRDSAHTLAALFAVGHPEVAAGFKTFIERTTAGHAEDLQVMYGCYGERRLTEEELPHLDGYMGSRPVRIGNGAVNQRQLDVYGELMNAAHLWRRAGSDVTEDGWPFLRGLVDAAAAHWMDTDRGIWEVRGEPRHFVESKVMCWVALERGIQAAEETHPRLACDLERWHSVRAELRQTIEERGIDTARGCFVQTFGSKEVDASLLLLPLVGFIDPNDPRMLRTVEAIEQDLSDGLLVRRYRTEAVDDGVSGDEGSFLMASFWLVDVLAMQGRLTEAEDRFRRLLDLRNDVGLLAEECDRVTHAPLGNFPQAFTHMALVNSAEQLRRSRTGEDHTRPIADRGNSRPECPLTSPTTHHGRPLEAPRS